MEVAKEIRERITTCRLNISRIPEKTFGQFKEFSDEEFCSDYGLTLKFLCDFYFGLIPKGTELLDLEIMRLRNDFEEFKARVNEQNNKPKQRVMLDGTKRS